MNRQGIASIMLAAMMCGGGGARNAEATIMAWDWATRAPEFDADATPTRLPILLYFGADWCGFCKEMDRTTLADQTVHIQLATLVHVKLDIDQQEALAKQFNIEGVPAFLLVNERGEEVSRLVGATDAVTFVQWIEAGEKKEAGIASAAEKRLAELRLIAAAQASSDPAAQASAREKAFACIGRGEPAAQKVAAGYLGHVALTDPQALLEGLENSDLAVRIAVANLLRSQFGEKGAFDPWAGAVERSAEIAQLRKQLTAVNGKAAP